VLLLSGLVLTSSVSTNYLVFRAFDLRCRRWRVRAAILQLGTAVIVGASNVVFQYLTILTLASWDVPESTALAAALVLHVREPRAARRAWRARRPSFRLRSAR
jgi:hypothetical protein